MALKEEVEFWEQPEVGSENPPDTIFDIAKMYALSHGKKSPLEMRFNVQYIIQFMR